MTLSPTHFAVLIVALTAACSDSSEPGSPSPAGPAEFIGSAACESCHTTQYQDWLGSHHELAMQVADSATVLADFAGTEFEYFDATTYFLTRDGEYYVRTRDWRAGREEIRLLRRVGISVIRSGRQPVPPRVAWVLRPVRHVRQRAFGMLLTQLFPHDF